MATPNVRSLRSSIMPHDMVNFKRQNMNPSDFQKFVAEQRLKRKGYKLVKDSFKGKPKRIKTEVI